MTKTLLLVDDDKELCELLADYLQGEGFECASVNSGIQALEHLLDHRYDAIVLDIMMPQMSGLELLPKLRKLYATPVIMLTGRGDDIDRIVGLEMGADDYLGKPCNPRELAARLRAVMRRTQAVAALNDNDPAPLLELQGLVLNAAKLEVSFRGQVLLLTSAEIAVLKQLMQAAGHVISKELLTREALNREYTDYDRSIDVHISRIRQKLTAAGGDSDWIRSVRGVGYQFLVDVSA
ncbi:MAG: response regulator transcription factor [Marinagarivorans sp.]|nr:response regulator transcription factor [Marinagarivorans sp.]